jgi:integrase
MKKTAPIRDKVDVYRFLKHLRSWNSNYYIAAIIGIQWGLRCSDILVLQVGDVVAGEGSRIQITDRIMVREIKTGHERNILITDKMKDILHDHIKSRGSRVDMDAPLVMSRNKTCGRQRALSRKRLWAVISQTAKSLGIKGPIGTHSMRKTWAHQAWKSGKRVDVIQKELGHTSIETTYRYACIPDETRDDLYKAVDFAIPSRRRDKQKRKDF